MEHLKLQIQVRDSKQIRRTSLEEIQRLMGFKNLTAAFDYCIEAGLNKANKGSSQNQSDN